jgi:5'(3')-deoxyribonucleotidase
VGLRSAVDLDGVLYEFQRTYRYMIREYRGVEMPPVAEFWTTWDAQKQYGTPADHRWMWDEGVKRGLFRYGHMVTGGRRGLERLAEDGHELIIVTSRPESAVNDTMEWCSLLLKDIPIVGFHILSNGERKTSIDWDVLIDDRPENIEDALSAGRKAVLFQQPWNDNYITLAQEANGWKEVPDAIRSC